MEGAQCRWAARRSESSMHGAPVGRTTKAVLGGGGAAAAFSRPKAIAGRQKESRTMGKTRGPTEYDRRSLALRESPATRAIRQHGAQVLHAHVACCEWLRLEPQRGSMTSLRTSPLRGRAAGIAVCTLCGIRPGYGTRGISHPQPGRRLRAPPNKSAAACGPGGRWGV